MGDALLAYRGPTGDGRVAIDVIIPAFDPQRAYTHRISIREGRKGFRLLNRVYRLLAAGSRSARLEPEPACGNC